MMGIELASGVACGASVSYAVTREGNGQTSRDFSDKSFISVVYCVLQHLPV